MRELTKVLILSGILILVGIISAQLMAYSPDFNFYKSEISIDGENISETLYYHADKEYHTLFRNFVDPIFKSGEEPSLFNSYLTLSSVTCSNGKAYIRDYYGKCTDASESFLCYSYTESNEYGCSFGDEYGFKQGKEYTISSTYSVYPENLFLINGNYYIKFVVYSPGNHKYLNTANFVISNPEVIRANKYYPNDNVVIYIPYSGDISQFNIINKDNFEFDTKNLFLIYLLSILPGLILFLSWFFYGKEKTEEDIPNQLSMFANEKRKPWEVSEFFNAPFATVGPNFFAATLLSFYHNKIIDVKSIEKKRFLFTRKEMYLRLNTFKGDKIEKQVYELLQEIKKGASKEDLDGDYFNFTHSMESMSVQSKMRARASILQKEIRKMSKDYKSSKGFPVASIGLLVVAILTFYLGLEVLFPLMFISFFLFLLIESSSAILSQFKGNNYLEYQKWQSFKKYLSQSFTIRKGDTQMVKLWDEYLIYSAALGVSKKVIEELKAKELIDEKHYIIYTGINTSSISFASSSGTSGGHSGAGGGGVGGGGGGGR